jgi:Fur family peroxide stress response transcriptional regulator
LLKTNFTVGRRPEPRPAARDRRADDLSARLKWALQVLSKAHVRITPVREKVLGFLARHHDPATLHEIGSSRELADRFDEATVYRTLVLLVELNVARQLQFSGHSASFMLSPPGESFTFLICRCCHHITRIAPMHALHRVEQLAPELYRYSQLNYKLELYGLCPDCQQHTDHCVTPSKFTPGLRLRRSHS